jgi:hypothetical protein
MSDSRIFDKVSLTVQWVLLSLFLLGVSFVFWQIGIGFWAGMTLAQFNLITGQGVILAGVIVILKKMEE